tara:strand:+ start:214 stop:1050 length:837 start_codon:yes stop_codon:yes gene_type:complete
MATETGRDDFIIAIRSAFLKKGTRQKFSLFTLLIISILVLSLEYFKSGPVDKLRSITKDIIFKSSYVVSRPFIVLNEKYHLFQEHINMYENFKTLENQNLKLESIEIKNKFLIAENARLKKLIEEKNSFIEDYTLTKVLLDQQSPYLKSIIINKGFDSEIKIGSGVKVNSYFVGKIVNVNYMTSRVLLASDLNSKIPVIVEPGSVNAILTGNGNNEWAELDYLPKINDIKDGYIVYTSGIDGNISEGIPVGIVFINKNKKIVKFFVDFNQLKYVKVVK